MSYRSIIYSLRQKIFIPKQKNWIGIPHSVCSLRSSQPQDLHDFYFNVKLLLGPGKVYDLTTCGRVPRPSIEKPPHEKNTH